MFGPLANEIGRPLHAHKVTSPEEYEAWARRRLEKRGHRWHGIRLAQLTGHGLSPDAPAFVSDGRWVVQCVCGNCPSASPEWGLAICGECGLTIEPTFPKDWERAEAALLARPHPSLRHYFWHAEHLHHPDGSPKYAGFVRDGKPETARTLEWENGRSLGKDWRERDRASYPAHPRALPHPLRSDGR